MAPLRLVALGSSFAAGAGIPPIIHKKAMRSGRNYAHLLATRLDADLIDLTVSGATLLNILDQPQKLFGLLAGSVPPQLEGLPRDADIVTLTAGGNDLFYSGGMIIDALKSSFRSIPLLGYLLSSYLGPNSDQTPITIDELSSRFITIIDKIASIAPGAKIVLVDYLTVFSPASRTTPENPLVGDEMQRYREVGDHLQQAYQSAVEARPFVSLLLASVMSIDHGVGTAEPWVTAFGWMMLLRGNVPYHPNAIGHEKIADGLHDLLTKHLKSTDNRNDQI